MPGGRPPLPFGEGRSRRRYLPAHRVLHRVEYSELEHLLQAQRGLGGRSPPISSGKRRPLERRQPSMQRKERQRQLPARQVRAERLADLVLAAEEVGEVIIDLVGDAEVPAEPVRRVT